LKYKVKGMIVTFQHKDYYPGEIIETDKILNNPHLELIEEGEKDDKPRSSKGRSKRSRQQDND